MALQDFNAITTKQTYTYKRNPFHSSSFMIMRREDNGAYNPIGDYTVLKREEDPDLSEKKVMNLITLLNGKENLIQLGAETKSRLLFKEPEYNEETGRTRTVFYELGNEGVSVENAVLTIEDKNDD